MNLNKTLGELFKHIQSQKKPVHIGWENILDWDDNVLSQLVSEGLITSTTKAHSIHCHGCDYACFKEVLFAEKVKNKADRAFIVCEVPEMQEQMGRIAIPIDHLKRWKTSSEHVARTIAKLLSLEANFDSGSNSSGIKIGTLKGSKGRRWISLIHSPLAIELNQRQLPIQDVLFFEDHTLTLDIDWINHTLNLAPLAQTKAYTPTKDKQEERKAITQAMYQDWRDEYYKYKKKHPNQSDKWISKQIAKLKIAKGLSSETIRKNMKN